MPVGFIQNELDLKLLVLYIMSRAAGPISFLQLWELARCDAGVDYFSLSQVTEHMVATGQLLKEGERYTITEKGRRNSQICERSLPFSVRMHCDENLSPLNQALRLEAQVRSEIADNEDGTVFLRLALNDEHIDLFRLELLAPSREQAERWAEGFRADPSSLYLGLTRLLDTAQPKQEE